MHIELHYLPSIEYVGLLLQADAITFEMHEHYSKQTARNRTRILGANGVETLIIPTCHTSSGKQCMHDVQVDYSQAWIRRHMGAIQAAYGNAPYFEYFEPLIQQIFAKKSKFLVDLNIQFLDLTAKILGTRFNHTMTESFQMDVDTSYWNQLHVKQHWSERSYYNISPYRQCFGDHFEPNLSILDLLMNHGKESLDIIKLSSTKNI